MGDHNSNTCDTCHGYDYRDCECTRKRKESLNDGEARRLRIRVDMLQGEVKRQEELRKFYEDALEKEQELTAVLKEELVEVTRKVCGKDAARKLKRTIDGLFKKVVLPKR